MRERMPELEQQQADDKKRKENFEGGSRLIGCKRICLSDLQRDVYPSSRFRQVQTRCLAMVRHGAREGDSALRLDKDEIKRVLLSLRRANREILRANKVESALNDFVRLRLQMN